MAKRVFLHVGAPKSGTTFLQTVLWNNRALLEADKILLPGRDLFDHNLAVTAIRNPEPRNKLQHRAKATWRRLREEMDAWSGDAVITNEWFVRADAEQAARGRRDLADTELHIVYTARALVHQVPAAWQETLKVGRGWAMNDFIAGLDDDSAQWSWLALDPALALKRWVGDLPPGRIHVVTVPPKGSDPGLLWKRLCAVLDIDPQRYDASTAEANESLGAEAARLLERMGPELRTAIGADEASWTEQYRWIRRYMGHELLVPRGGSRIGANAEQAAALHARSVTAANALGDAGYDIVGDLDDLRLADPPAGSRDPSSVSDSEMLDVAIPLVADLFARVREATLRAEHAEKAQASEATDDGEHEGESNRSDRGERVIGGGLSRDVDGERGSTDRSIGGSPVPSTDRVYFLVFSADGADGITRTVFSLANQLVKTHAVEIISLYRRRRRLFFPLDRRVVVTNLEDARPIGPKGNRTGGLVRAREVPQDRGRLRAFLDKRRSRLVPPKAAPDMSLLTDLLLRRKLRSLTPGVLITARPSLHAAAVRYAPRDMITIGQDHLNFETRSTTPAILKLVQDSARRLDSFVVLTPGDQRDYAAAMPEADTVIEAIPNGVPWAIGEASPLDSKIAIAAGRFVERKGFPRLVEAYEPVARAHPDWQLHIYGKGTQQDLIEREITERGLNDHVILKGHVDKFAEELAGASMFVTGSYAEGFPMVMIEAMSYGLPVVSFDIPRGPSDIIVDGDNGRLLPDGDIAGFSEAMLQLVGDDDVRRRMGLAAHASAKQYEIEAIATRWEALFTQLVERRAG
ncbi:MAG TPA: glycosyltransferase [Nocardioidaceae bacterium]|nr:glycosyltransferase [Nocardioidaceae bacterium]